MLIDFHMLKSFPPTNLNRDETGSPKTCYFGGTQRGRISSQSIKHSWRRTSEFSRLPIGIRTRFLPELICEELKRRNVPDEFLDAVKKKVTSFGNKDGKENDDLTTSQIMFFAKEDIAAIADLVQKAIERVADVKEFNKLKVKEWQDILKRQVRPITLDMALFGRMITDDSFKDVEASLQVAHAISTHVVNQESDFYTAVDDLQKIYGQDAGSAMMGDLDYNSCCYYFYASLDTDQLKGNLQHSPEAMAALPQLLPILIECMAYTNPSGKQNTFAGHSYPDLICVERKERKIPINYANAFEKPVYGREGYIIPSISALAKEIDEFESRFKLPIKDRLWFCTRSDIKPKNAQLVETLPDLKERVADWLVE